MFQDTELQVLLDENYAQTQQELAEQLEVSKWTISDLLKAIGKFQKEGKWAPYELNERQQENQKTISEMLLARYKKTSILHRIVTGDKKWIS